MVKHYRPTWKSAVIKTILDFMKTLYKAYIFQSCWLGTGKKVGRGGGAGADRVSPAANPGILTDVSIIYTCTQTLTCREYPKQNATL